MSNLEDKMSQYQEEASEQRAARKYPVAPVGKYSFILNCVNLTKHDGSEYKTKDGKRFYTISLTVTNCVSGKSFDIMDTIFGSKDIEKILKAFNHQIETKGEKPSLDDLEDSVGSEGLCVVGIRQDQKGEDANKINCYIPRKKQDTFLEGSKSTHQKVNTQSAKDDDDDVPF